MKKKLMKWLKKKLEKYQVLEQKKFNQWLIDTTQHKAIIAINKKKSEYFSAGNMKMVDECNEIEKIVWTEIQEFKLKAKEKYE